MKISLEVFEKKAFVRVYDSYEELAFTIQGDKYSLILTPVCFKAIGITLEKSDDWLNCFAYASVVMHNRECDNKEVEKIRKTFWAWKKKRESEKS